MSIKNLIRCYDYGGRGDRYTIVYLKPETVRGELLYHYRSCDTDPFHPMGIGMMGSSVYRPVDKDGDRLVRVGRKNHLGRRIRFEDLPEQVQKLIRQDLSEPWWSNDSQ